MHLILLGNIFKVHPHQQSPKVYGNTAERVSNRSPGNSFLPRQKRRKIGLVKYFFFFMRIDIIIIHLYDNRSN